MFEKNLEFIENKNLKDRLLNISLETSKNNMSYCMTESNDYLLMKNDIPLDDMDDPRKAVQDMLKATIKRPMEQNDIIITFGIGLCYQLDEVFNTYPSRIFVYEPDTELLHFVLNNVDISDHLKSGRVFIFDNLDELINKLSNIYITKDKVEVVYLKNYAVIKSQELLELSRKVYESCKSKTVDINTITRFSKDWLENTIKNISCINNSQAYMISDLDDKFIGETAVIAAAGPSLAENIQIIKDNREKFVVFAVNKTLRALIENNIIPDFVVCVDAKNVEKTLIGLEEYLPKISCIMNLNSDSSILTKNFKKYFISFPENDIVIKKLNEYNPDIKTREFGGSATTTAFVTAVKMGFSKIILTGVDLALKNNTVYSTGETYQTLSENQVVINSIVKNVTKVPSVNGGEVLTTDDYAAFIHHFNTLIKDLNYTEVYNTTSFGANISGMKNAKFDSILLLGLSNTTAIKLGEVKPFKFNVDKWVQNELTLINNVIEFLSKGSFSPALIASIVKSSLMYQYMQANILEVLQSKMADNLAEDFINKTKESVKIIIDYLQKYGLI